MIYHGYILKADCHFEQIVILNEQKKKRTIDGFTE